MCHCIFVRINTHVYSKYHALLYRATDTEERRRYTLIPMSLATHTPHFYLFCCVYVFHLSLKGSKTCWGYFTSKYPLYSSLFFVTSRYRKVYRQKSSCIYINNFITITAQCIIWLKMILNLWFVTKTQDWNELIYLMTYEFLSKQTWKTTRKRTISYNYKS